MTTEVQSIATPVEGVQEALPAAPPAELAGPTLEQQAERIRSLPKRQQGPEIDAAIDALIRDGYVKSNSIEIVAQALGMKPATVSVGYYRRNREPQPAPAPAPADNGEPAVSATVYQIEALIEREVARRVKERMAAVRAALG